MVVYVGDGEQALVVEFDDVLELGGGHVVLLNGLAYLQELVTQYEIPSGATTTTRGCATKNISARKEA